MTKRWTGLLLLLAALAPDAPALRAQPGRGGRRIDSEPQRPSHRPIDNGLENDASPQMRLERRLKARRKEDQNKLDDDFRALAKELLNRKDFAEALKAKLREDGMKPEEVEKWKKTIDANRDLANDPVMKKLVEESLTGQTLKNDEKSRELIRKWKEISDKGGGGNNPPAQGDGQQGNQPGQGPGGQPPPGLQPGADAPKQPPGTESLPKETPEWLKDGLSDGARGLSRWLDSPSGRSFRDSLKGLGKRTAEFRSSAAGERARGTVRNLPRPGKWLTSNLRPSPRIGESLPRAGSAPRVNAPAASVPRASATSVFEVILYVAAGVGLLIVAWKTRGLWKGVLSSLGGGSTWRLGPWPVRPGAVATRGDLVRAFEHLALLCLGRSARSHHHLDLGRLIGEQPALDPDRRREAAATLARLYEKARYVPDDEPLAPGDVEDARRELTYLAGGNAA
jgi:hypothetical protein